MDTPIQENVTVDTTTDVVNDEQQTNVDVQDTTSQQQEQVTTDTDYSPFLKVISEKAKYNGEPITIESIDDVVVNFQKGMNYDKIHERYQALQSDPGLTFINEVAQANGMTVQEYVEAAREWQRQQELEQLISERQLPEDVARELLESRRFREEYRANQTTAQQKAQKDAEMMEFIQAYPDVKELPPEVWAEVDKGMSMVDAYTRYENQQLKERIAKLEQSLDVRDKNLENAQTSTGSVTGQGNVPTNNFTREQVEKMSQADVHKNYDAIIESMKHWK